MGVPAFFRWLTRKYPSVVVNCNEQKADVIDGVAVPVDATQPNPIGVEFDNLYLDMNGIIHPCTHPEHKVAPKNEDEMMEAIFEYIDRLFKIVRPRRVLYMAIDGVAPRAKMNQQRSRRFRAAKEGYEKREEIRKVRQKLQNEGMPLPPEKSDAEHFDSNCITPGTPFMKNLSVALQFYIQERLNTDPSWANIEVILSDANVPGEGEHKIMDFIRKQRASPGHDPNTHHVLCGADADLIMLGLATHEPNFTIIREEFIPNKMKPCELCGQYGHELNECQGLPKDEESENPLANVSGEANFIFIRLNVLREYLERELTIPNLPFEFDLERALDDWVFMCFFVGNDFLPHLPSLEIRENAIDRLVELYKKAIYRAGGYVTDSGRVNVERVQLILDDLGEVEDSIFKMRQENELERRRKAKIRRRRQRAQTAPAYIPGGQFQPTQLGHRTNPGPIQNPRQEAAGMRRANMDAAQSLKASLSGGGDSQQRGTKRRYPVDSDSEEETPDEIRLWEDGWKERYYQSKFEVSSDDTKFRYKVASAYVEGLCWVLAYYYQGCPSWKWFFPFHYAPFASDFIGMSAAKVKFDQKTEPFKPHEQLMGVFPAASKKHLPVSWGALMDDPESPIIDFYPEDFLIDLNGKKFAWQGVALLPFVDEVRLLSALKPVYSTLNEEEANRNRLGESLIFVSQHHKAFNFLADAATEDGGDKDEDAWIKLDGSLCYGMAGTIASCKTVAMPNCPLRSPIAQCEGLPNNRSVGTFYRDPAFQDGYIFKACRLEGAEDPPKTLKPGDYDEKRRGPYVPVTGFTRDRPRANLDVSGQRMLRANLGRNNSSGYNYPPNPQGNRYCGPSANSYGQMDHRSGGGGNFHNDRSFGGRGQGYSGSGSYRGSWVSGGTYSGDQWRSQMQQSAQSFQQDFYRSFSNEHRPRGGGHNQFRRPNYY